jgi:REP element-mobilizing transposase RayT
LSYRPDLHQRRSIRLQGFDYAHSGAYFVTVCSHGRECLFGEVVDGVVELNASGQMLEYWLDELPRKFQWVTTDASVVMPNHIHTIIIITDESIDKHAQGDEITPVDVGAPLRGCPGLDAPSGLDANGCPGRPHRVEGRPHRVAPTLGAVVGWWKTMTTNAYIHGVNGKGWPPFCGRLWQRNYYERVIRNETELAAIREYIASNPGSWDQDRNHPENITSAPGQSR